MRGYGHKNPFNLVVRKSIKNVNKSCYSTYQSSERKLKINSYLSFTIYFGT